MITIRQKIQNSKNALTFTILVECDWLTNLSLLFGSNKVLQSLIQSHDSIESYRL